VNINTSSSSPLSSITPYRVRSTTASNSSETEVSSQDLKQIQQLKARDQVVRAHEAAHVAAGGGLVRGGANFSFQRGPDGVQYAIGGEVQIDASKVSGDPQATLQKAQQIQAAALAPAQPSAQDRSVAARAAQMAIEARAEISQQQNSDDNNQASSFAFSVDEPLPANELDLTA